MEASKLRVLKLQTLLIGLSLLSVLSSPSLWADGLKPVFDGHSGERVRWPQVYAAMEKADIVILGEQHTDAPGHALQVRIIVDVLDRWENVALGLEEFDRSQQVEVSEFQDGKMTGAELKSVRDFVDPEVRRNWLDWYLPKLEAARQGGATLVATNAPLKYSRLVRNVGCDNLPEMPEDERSLFECPVAPPDPDYRKRFGQTMKSIAAGNRASGLKPLGDEQIDKMFRAHRVWDATMAQSIADARSAGGGKVLHLVGSFHADYGGGLVQEVRARDPEAKILVLCLTPKRGMALSSDDADRADFVIYTKN